MSSTDTSAKPSLVMAAAKRSTCARPGNTKLRLSVA
jgi:hypothetical protein